MKEYKMPLNYRKMIVNWHLKLHCLQLSDKKIREADIIQHLKQDLSMLKPVELSEKAFWNHHKSLKLYLPQCQWLLAEVWLVNDQTKTNSMMKIKIARKESQDLWSSSSLVGIQWLVHLWQPFHGPSKKQDFCLDVR